MASDTPSILIVDDSADKLVALESILLDLRVDIVKARSGKEALRRLLAQDFAVVLLDVRMPVLDGFETATLIRERSRTEHTPIIFITAFGDETHVARGYSLKAVDYILTPVVPEVLRTKVSVFVELFRATAEMKRHADSLRQRAAQLPPQLRRGWCRSGRWHDARGQASRLGGVAMNGDDGVAHLRQCA